VIERTPDWAIVVGMRDLGVVTTHSALAAREALRTAERRGDALPAYVVAVLVAAAQEGA
jgi:hypothetical protein